MSAIFSHGILHEWINFNPISKVRCSTKRLLEPEVLTPAEFQPLSLELPVREHTMVMPGLCAVLNSLHLGGVM